MAKVFSLPNSFPNADSRLETALGRFAAQTAFTISSTREPDMPIIYVSSEFCKMTGYSKKEILGRNCRFLQGPGTSRQAVQEIRNCIQEDRGCTVCLMNYTKDGKPFWNQLCLAPVRDENGVTCYLGIQTNVTGAVLAFRSQQFSPFQPKAAGPHGGVHSFTCPEIVAKEMEDAKRMEGTIKRWNSENLESITATPSDFRPVSAKHLPASLLAPLYKLQQSYVLADPNLPDMPIVHASEGFLRLTGRPRNQVVGHNCRFMQGPLTDRAELQRLRDAIKDGTAVTVRLLNYKANGELFWNNLHVAPIRDADGKIVFYVGCQLDVTLHHAEQQGGIVSGNAKAALSNSSIATIPETEIAKETEASFKNELPSTPAVQLSPAVQAGQSDLLAVLHGEEPASARQDGTGIPERSSRGQEGLAAPSREGILPPGDSQAPAFSTPVPQAKMKLSPMARQQQRSVIGAVRVVCRSLSSKTGLRRSLEDQHLPRGKDDCAIPQVRLDRREEDSSATRLDMPNLGSSHL